MDIEMIKTILVEIIREAQNLPSNELETINGTDVAVKRGRSDEFKAYARLYVEIAHNVKVENGFDYVTRAFNDLANEIKEDENEFYISKAEEFYNSNFSNVEKFNQAQKTLYTISRNNLNLQKRFQELQTNMQKQVLTSEQLTQFDSISSDIRDFSNGMGHLRTTLMDLRKQINANFVDAATNQLETLRNNYANTANSITAAYSSDGKSILASDKEEYDNILKLIEITKRINENEPLIIVNDTICVNVSQEQEVKDLLATSKLFSKVEKPVHSPLSLNDKLLATLESRIKTFESGDEKLSHNIDDLSKLPVDSLTAYESLLELQRILRESNNNYLPKEKRTEFNKSYSEQYVGVWNAAFVHESFKERVDALLRKTNILKDQDPSLSKHADNEKLILLLENHKKALEDITPLGQGNVLTSIAADGVTIVRDEFLDEFNAVIGALDILYASRDENDLREVWGIGSVRSDDVLNFKKYISKISVLSKKVPGLSANDLAIDAINAKLTDLNDLARTRKKENPNAILAPNGVVLHEDLSLYNALLEQLKFLELSKGQENLLEVDGAFVAPKYLASYNDALKKEQDARNNASVLGGTTPSNGGSTPGAGASGTSTGSSAGSGSTGGSSNIPPVTFIDNNINTAQKEFVKNNIKYLLELADGVPAKLISHLGGLTANESVMQALLELKECLDNADKANINDLIDINGTKICKDDEAKFKAAMGACEQASIMTYNSIRMEEIEAQIGLLTSAAIGVPEGTKIHEAITIDGKKVLNIDKEKLDSLLTIASLLEKYLQVSTEEEEKDFIKIDGIYIHKDDEEKYKQALENLNKVEASITANDKFLKETIEKIYKLVADCASSMDTNVVTIGDFTVLKANEAELQALLDIKDCLEDARLASEAELTEIDGIKVKLSDEIKYNAAISKLKGLNNPNKTANEAKIAEIDAMIDKLVSNASGLETSKLVTIEGFTVALADEDKLQTLLAMKNLLTEATKLPDSECKIIDGLKISKKDEAKYLETAEALNNIINNKTANEKKEEEINNSIAALVAKAANAPDDETMEVEGYKILASDEDDLNKLLDLKDCLERAKTSNNLVEQKDGVMIDKKDSKLYRNSNKPQRQKVSIRKLGSKTLATLKAHKKAAAIGLAASALCFWGAALFAPGIITGVLVALPAAIKEVVISNIGGVALGTAGFASLAGAEYAVTKGVYSAKDYAANNVNAIGKPSITANDLILGKIAKDSHRKYTGTVTEEELDDLGSLSVDEQIDRQMAKLDNIHKMIDERVKEINEISSEVRAEKRKQDNRVLTPYTVVSEEPVQVVTIPSNEELMESISDKNLIMAQVDQYVDKVLAKEDGFIYSRPIRELTGIDLFKYNVSDPEKVALAKKDIDEALNKWDPSYILGQATNYFNAVKNNEDSSEYRDIVKSVTDINLDEFEINKKNIEILQEDIRAAMKRKHDNLMAQLIFAQAENYRIASKNNQDTTVMRDAVYGATGVDLDKYDLSDDNDMHQADAELTKALKSSNEALIEDLNRKVADLQALIDAGIAPAEEIVKAEADKQKLLERIDSLSENKERGI